MEDDDSYRLEGGKRSRIDEWVVIEWRSESPTDPTWDQMWYVVETVRVEVDPPTIRGLVIGVVVEPSITSGLAIGIDVGLLMTIG